MMKALALAIALTVLTIPTMAASARTARPLDADAIYTPVLAAPELYPSTFDTGGVTDYYSSADDLCRPVTDSCPRDLGYTARAVYGADNQGLAMGHHFLDGARTFAHGPGWNAYGCNPTIPYIEVAVGRFPTAADARSASQALRGPILPNASARTQQVTDIGAGGALLTTGLNTDGGGSPVQQLTFSRGPFAVLIFMVWTDGSSVLRLGRATDQRLSTATKAIAVLTAGPRFSLARGPSWPD